MGDFIHPTSYPPPRRGFRSPAESDVIMIYVEDGHWHIRLTSYAKILRFSPTAAADATATRL